MTSSTTSHTGNDLDQLCLRVARRPTTHRVIAKRLRAAARSGAGGGPLAAARYAIGCADGISMQSATELRRALGQSVGLLIDIRADVRQAVAHELRARIDALFADQARADIELAAIRQAGVAPDATNHTIAKRNRQIQYLEQLSQTRRAQSSTLASFALTLGFPEIFDEWVF
jgi:hypothetical protein